MFGIGMTEMIIIAVVALIFIGPDQIPEVARNVGKFMNDLKRSTDDLKKDFQNQTGLPRNFDEWLENRRDQPQNQIAPPAHLANKTPGEGAVDPEHDPHHDPYAGLLEDNHEPAAVQVTGSSGYGHPPTDEDGQTSMNLESETDQKDPKKS